ncbi:proteinaceous RNase P 1, chloroplastic/mitochondrial-like isoform X2 [Aristolochia californica]|uniref:proteinaceous RNase P 1, chloroplastic/mitochondrial-like isoform X2 n=1 Tax=Aristolochia californica TaxID=171875 RepID=UPI0035DB766D
MLRHPSLFSFFSKTSSPSPPCLHLPLFKLLSLNYNFKLCNHFFTTTIVDRKSSFSEDIHISALPSSKSQSISASMRTWEIAQESVSSPSKRLTKKIRREAPENVLRHKLDMCSKNGQLHEALCLYDEARENQIPLSQHHYNVLLYLCSSFPSNTNDNEDDQISLGIERGFEIFHQMDIDQVPPNEATFTSLARLAAAKEDPDLAFNLIKRMENYKISPRLRSYGPALFGFCMKGDPDGAYAVETHMSAFGVSPEEPELAALLQVSADSGKGERVYQFIHQLRSTVRQVSESTAKILEMWFLSHAAAMVGDKKWDQAKVKEGVVKCGGGAHGIGWLGRGEWKVVRSVMDDDGVCGACGERLVCIDIDPVETENFGNSLSRLACEKEVKANFTRFQWLARSGPFEAVVDGANVALHDQKHFSFRQLNAVVNGIRQSSQTKKLPLVVLHSRRVKGGPADNPNNKKLLEKWRMAGALYATPPGSNDDWYWLYAAVSNKCLLVTNDKMRDHLFELLGKSFFPRWMEKHQVRLTFSRDDGLTFHMPPPYSIVIQESERGYWHIPILTEDDDIETPRQWVCASRAHGTPSKQYH